MLMQTATRSRPRPKQRQHARTRTDVHMHRHTCKQWQQQPAQPSLEESYWCFLSTNTFVLVCVCVCARTRVCVCVCAAHLEEDRRVLAPSPPPLPPVSGSSRMPARGDILASSMSDMLSASSLLTPAHTPRTPRTPHTPCATPKHTRPVVTRPSPLAPPARAEESAPWGLPTVTTQYPLFTWST